MTAGAESNSKKVTSNKTCSREVIQVEGKDSHLRMNRMSTQQKMQYKSLMSWRNAAG
jgi:hypothetical protein